MRWSFTVTYTDGREERVFVEGSRRTARLLASTVRENYPEATVTGVRSENLVTS